MTGESIVYFLIAGAMLYMLYRFVRNQKEAFSSTNILKSLYTLGILALCLIAFIAYCVWMLQSSENF